MNQLKLSTHFALESSPLLRSLAKDFETKRDLTTLVRLLMAISELRHNAALDAITSYLKDTSSQRIDPDWDQYLKFIPPTPPQDASF